MQTKAVAEYAYDHAGRLRAKWDPRVSPALKTVYGYDAEGHVTSVSAPGQQPWLIAYGTIAGEANPGRALSATRPPASGKGESTEAKEVSEAKEKSAPSVSTIPTLSSTSAKVGVKLSVTTNGTWKESPLAYSYAWEHCNGAGGECTPIAGAVNASYYPAASDEGHTLRGLVTASNATGATGTASAATGTVASGTPVNTAPEPPAKNSNSVWSIDYQVPVTGAGAPHEMSSKELETWGQTNDEPVEAAAVFPPDEPMGWPAANYTRAHIYYMDSSGRTVNVANPAGGISTSEYNTNNDVVRSLSADNRAAARKETGKTKTASESLDTKSTYSEQGSGLLETLGPEHKVKLEGGAEVMARNHIRYFYNEGAPGGETYDLVTKTIDGAYMPGQEEANLRVTTTSYSGQENLGWKLRKPTSITNNPKTGLENQLKFAFGTPGTENGQFSKPSGVAVAANGNVCMSSMPATIECRSSALRADISGSSVKKGSLALGVGDCGAGWCF